MKKKYGYIFETPKGNLVKVRIGSKASYKRKNPKARYIGISYEKYGF